MTASFAFANKGRINVAGVPPTAVDLGVVKDVEVTWSAEHVPLYGWGKIERQAVAKHTSKVTIKIGWMKIDPALSAGFQYYILNPTATGAASGLVEDGSSGTGNTVKLFTVIADFVFEGTPVQTMRGTISNVYFPTFPMKAAEGQWVKCDMTGEGSTIAWTVV